MLFNFPLIHCKVTAGTSEPDLAGMAKWKIGTLKLSVLWLPEKCRWVGRRSRVAQEVMMVRRRLPPIKGSAGNFSLLRV